MKGFWVLVRLFFVCVVATAGFGDGQKDNSKSLVIVGARLIDGTGSLPQDDAVIVMKGDKFEAVGPRGKVSLPKNAEVIDVKGKTVVPGLIDAHVHFTYPPNDLEFLLINDSISSYRAAAFLNRYLMAGVTTVRDIASYTNVGIMAKKAFSEGLFTGSRPIVSGQAITSTGGHGTEKYDKGTVTEVDGPDGFRRAVREQLKAGADLVKVFPPFSREELRAAIEETRLHERFITVHHPLFRAQYSFVRWAVEERPDCLEHAVSIPDDVIPAIATNKIYCVPTLSIILILADQIQARKEPGWEWESKKRFDSVQTFRKLKEAGVKMGIGTDAVKELAAEYPGIFFKEIELFVENGYTPMEAIVAATKINSEICDASDKLGTIETGKLADLLVLEQDPLRDIKALRNIQIIIQGGKVIKR